MNLEQNPEYTCNIVLVYMFTIQVFEYHVFLLLLLFLISSVQVADLFTLKDEAVKGYTSWTVITELHTHIQDCAVEYT